MSPNTGRQAAEETRTLTTAHLQESFGVGGESLERALGLRELQPGAGGDVADGDAAAEVVDRLHGAVPHVGGEAVRLHGAAGAREPGPRRRPDGAPGARPHVGAPRGRRGPARGDAEALGRGARGGEEEGGMARGPAGRREGRAETHVEG